MKKLSLDKNLIQAVVSQFRLPLTSVHGPAHWMRVRRNGLEIAEYTGANKNVVELFALFHDSCRLNDYEDPEHGYRGGLLAAEYFYNKRMLNCSEAELHTLSTACEYHTNTHQHDDITVATCWDADRLDLPRVYIDVDPMRLATDYARQYHVIEAAKNSADAWLCRYKTRGWPSKAR